MKPVFALETALEKAVKYAVKVQIKNAQGNKCFVVNVGD